MSPGRTASEQSGELSDTVVLADGTGTEADWKGQLITHVSPLQWRRLGLWLLHPGLVSPSMPGAPAPLLNLACYCFQPFNCSRIHITYHLRPPNFHGSKAVPCL